MSSSPSPAAQVVVAPPSIPGEPPSPEDLGRSGWNVLHTAAAVFPNKPTEQQRQSMRDFFASFAQVYACSTCAFHLRRHLAKHPPDVTDKRSLSSYVCDAHNKVNKFLGKPVMDCDPDVVLRRWHPTYPRMDDVPPLEEQIAAEQRRLALLAAEVKAKVEGENRRKELWWGFGGVPANVASTPYSSSSSSSAASTRLPRAADLGLGDGGRSGDVVDPSNPLSILSLLPVCRVYCPEKHKEI